jgi:hypothetical protein
MINSPAANPDADWMNVPTINIAASGTRLKRDARSNRDAGSDWARVTRSNIRIS